MTTTRRYYFSVIFHVYLGFRFFVHFFVFVFVAFLLYVGHTCFVCTDSSSSSVCRDDTRTAVVGARIMYCIPLFSRFSIPRNTVDAIYLTTTIFFFFFLTHIYFPASGQDVVTGVVPSSPRFFPSIFIAHSVQQSHCSSIFHRVSRFLHLVPGMSIC